MINTSSHLIASGGKGNAGMFFERSPKVCAAGMPSAQPGQSVADCLKFYLLQDEVDALIGDAIKPDPKLYEVLRKDPGLYSKAANLINPPVKTKCQTLAEDLKSTVYSSYWKAEVGIASDPTPFMSEGFDYKNTTFGKKTPRDPLYDVIMPKIKMPDKTPASKSPGHQTELNYCRPSFNPDHVFGMRVNVDPRGKWMKCCLTDDRISMGTLNQPIDSKQADLAYMHQSPLGKCRVLNENINCVPQGFSFGKLEPPSYHVPDCLTTCEHNKKRAFFKKCLSHLNRLRTFLSKRFQGTFFDSLYLELKYFDENKTGWLSKDFVYDVCSKKYIRFQQQLIEPLLISWNALNGSEIEFNVFLDVLNHRKVIPELPFVRDIPKHCVESRTIYSEMTSLDQESDKRLRAGLPSGRYIDMAYPITPQGYCKADRTYLPQETSTSSCLVPSIFTLYGISHRDLYAKRTPAIVRRVFEAAGEPFTDEEFEIVWNIAKQDHSEGHVCYETFRRALEKNKNC